MDKTYEEDQSDQVAETAGEAVAKAAREATMKVFILIFWFAGLASDCSWNYLQIMQMQTVSWKRMTDGKKRRTRCGCQAALKCWMLTSFGVDSQGRLTSCSWAQQQFPLTHRW